LRPLSVPAWDTGPWPCGLNSAPFRRISAPTLLPGKTDPMARTNPLQFLQQVRAEVAKIHWPSRREVMLTTVMVFILAALTATFFSLVDLAIRTGLAAVIGA